MNRQQLLALAIISGNDYVKNIYGFGIGRNIKIIQSLTITNDVTKIVEEYEIEMEVEKGY